jgi:acyl-CoA hydrolase
MHPQYFHYDRLVKSEDLNHHGTLFAGRSAEWFVEAGFIAAASALPAQNIVCLKVHGLTFTHPIKAGEIACFESKIVHTGRSSFVVYVRLKTQNQDEPLLTGFITFVHINAAGKAEPHHIELVLMTEEDVQLNKQASALN